MINQFPIFTIDHRILIDTGEQITEESIDKVIHVHNHDYPYIDLKDYNAIPNDLFRYIEQIPAYRTIFHEPEVKQELLAMAEEIRLPLPILESLNYFKQYEEYTYRHMLMVFALTSVLSKDLLSGHQNHVRSALSAPIHDIGKICVPLSILKKSTPLTRSELEHLKHHTIAGYVLSCYYFKKINGFPSRVARDHHERLDGSGYPFGIQLNDMMTEIVMVCDIFDALISPRPYRPVSFDNRTALEEITDLAVHGKIRWEIIQALIARNRKEHPRYQECIISSEKRGCCPKDNMYGIVATEKK